MLYDIANWVLAIGFVVLAFAAMRSTILWFLRVNEIIERLDGILARLDAILKEEE